MPAKKPPFAAKETEVPTESEIEAVGYNPDGEVDTDESLDTGEVSMFSRDRKLTVSMTRSYSGVPITFGVELIAKPDSFLQQQEVWDELLSELSEQHTHFINDLLSHLDKVIFENRNSASVSNGSNGSSSGNGSNLQTYTVAYIERGETQTGKKCYKVHTTSGKYKQFGINVFPDVAKALQISEVMTGTNRADYEPGEALIDVEESGKYGKVVAFYAGGGTDSSSSDSPDW